MPKWAVAVANLYENTNQIDIVEAETPVKAILKAVRETEEDLNTTFFTKKELSTVTGLIEYYFNGDMLVSNPVCLRGEFIAMHTGCAVKEIPPGSSHD